MQIAEVVGTVVSTQKNRKLEGAKLLLVQPLNLDGTPRGTALLAIDSSDGGSAPDARSLVASGAGPHRARDLREARQPFPLRASRQWRGMPHRTGRHLQSLRLLPVARPLSVFIPRDS
jgi:microcompartment protein CcmK/EutM